MDEPTHSPVIFPEVVGFTDLIPYSCPYALLHEGLLTSGIPSSSTLESTTVVMDPLRLFHESLDSLSAHEL